MTGNSTVGPGSVPRHTRGVSGRRERRPAVRTALTTLLLALYVSAHSAEPVRAQTTGTPPSATTTVPLPTISETVLRLARSADGINFTPDGGILFPRVSAPTLALLPSGETLLIVDAAAAPGSDGTALSVAKSNRRGDRWTSLRPIRFKGAGTSVPAPRHGALSDPPGRSLRLYFTANEPVPRGRGRRQPIESAIRSATTMNGLDYRLDRPIAARLAGTRDAYTTAAWYERRMQLFIDADDGDSESARTGSSTHHLLSDKGDRFARLSPVRIPGAAFRGCVVVAPSTAGGTTSAGKGLLRAYLTAPEGIVSAVSRDGREWKTEPGVRLAGGWHAAVARLKDGSYLMTYCAKPDEPTDSGTPSMVTGGVTGSADDPQWPAETAVIADAGDAGTPGPAEPGEANESAIDGADAVAADAPVTGEATDPEPGTDDPARESMPSPQGAGAADSVPADSAPFTGETKVEQKAAPSEAQGNGFPDPSENWRDYCNPVSYDGFAPPPDFQIKVDYIEWYREFALDKPTDNAYEDYAQVLRQMNGPDGEPVPINDMFNSKDYDGPPVAWKPEDHPEWDATGQRVAPWLEQYRVASRHNGFARPVDFGGVADTDPTYGPLLLQLLLPDLWAHRALAKAALADAWRVRDGDRPSPERMLEAWETVYRSASHLDRGATLIEDLVSVAERGLVQDSARRALKDGVFRSPEETQRAFETLRQFDHSDEDPGQSIRGEHAFAMEITQYLFSPPTAEGLPKLNGGRAEGLVKDELIGADALERMRQTTPEEVYDTIDAFDQYYRDLGQQMRIGYPDVREKDLAAMADRYVGTSPLTEAFLPALSRVHHLKGRDETSRRATQLAYATHLFHAREGRWPKSLDELPAEYGDKMRIDPFSGDYFRYEVTNDGPRIWSVSEDGLDGGGDHSPTWNAKGNPETGSDDFVFWPPQPR